jgi:putative transposon-encoded protein
VSGVSFSGNDVRGPMSEARLLTPHEAEAVIDDRIERFGLGALPRVSVTPLADGTWRLRWDRFERTVAPMTEAAWRAWLEENVGSLDAGDLETTEA